MLNLIKVDQMRLLFVVLFAVFLQAESIENYKPNFDALLKDTMDYCIATRDSTSYLCKSVQVHKSKSDFNNQLQLAIKHSSGFHKQRAEDLLRFQGIEINSN